MNRFSRPVARTFCLGLVAAALATTALTACTNFEKQPPRYNTVSGPKRAPVLNPGGAQYQPGAQGEEQQSSLSGAMPAGMMAGGSTPPPEAQAMDPTMMDLPPEQQAMMAQPPMGAEPDAAPAPGRKVPMGNQEPMAAEGGYVGTEMAAPMAPVMSSEPVMAAPAPEMAAAPEQPLMGQPAPPYAAQAEMAQAGDGTPPVVPPAGASSSALSRGQQPQPNEMAAYQPMTNENGEFPTLSEVPATPDGMQNNAAALKQEASSFTAASQSPDGLAAMPPASTPAAPSYEQEMQAAAPQPAPTPMQQAGQYYGDPAANQQMAYAPPPAPMQDYTVNAVPAAGEPVPPASVYQEPAPYDQGYGAPQASGTGLPPIQLRAPRTQMAARTGNFLPESRYMLRRMPDRPGTLRH